MVKMSYSHFQHRHNFAVWCAARAVQRKFAKTPVLKKALEKSGVVEFVRQYKNDQITEKDYDQLHAEWCESILQTWKLLSVNGATYGRAAKLIAVYIKSMTVLNDGESMLAEVAHPPIDRIILQNISKDKTVIHPNRQDWKGINWTELDKSQYQKLIRDLRSVIRDRPFWYLEHYWTITND